MTSARQVLSMEAQALLDAADRLDQTSFDDAVALLAGVRGKVLLLGAGTSGIIARKLAATMTSTGTPAFYLHPSDALHGGLGLVSGEDAVVALSNSGETEEVLTALPYLRHRAVPLVSIVGNTTSSLAAASDVVLEARADAEACPLGLAPTCSSTLALAVGDALAIGLMEAKGVTSDVFARNHPSGRLGRRLTLTVEALMHPTERLVTVGLDASWADLVMAIGEGGLGAVPVLDDGVLVGLVTDGDVRRHVARSAAAGGGDLTGVRAADLMTKDPVVVEPSLMAYDALRTMEDRPSQISVVPVVDDGVLVGLLRLHDLVRVGL